MSDASDRLPGENPNSEAQQGSDQVRPSIGHNNPPEKAEIAIDRLLDENPGIFLQDDEARERLFVEIKQEMADLESNVANKKGREAIRKAASSITKKKAHLNRARLELTRGWRKQVDDVNASGKVIDERLAEYAETVRAPLTKWEADQEAKQQRCESEIAKIRNAATITPEDTSESVRQRGSEIYTMEITKEIFGDRVDEAQSAKDATVAVLLTAKDRLKQEEDDRAELQKLREAQAIRDAEDQQRIAREKAKADQERERLAEAERKREAELAEAKRRADEAEAEAQKIKREQEAEADRIRQQQEREAEEKRQREADEEHRASCKSAAQKALIDAGVASSKAGKVVQSIMAGEIPHVRFVI